MSKKGVIVLYISKKLFYILPRYLSFTIQCMFQLPTLILERAKSFTSVTDNDVYVYVAGKLCTKLELDQIVTCSLDLKLSTIYLSGLIEDHSSEIRGLCLIK